MSKRFQDISVVVASILARDAIVDVNPDDVATSLIAIENEAYRVKYTDIVFHELFPIHNFSNELLTKFTYYYVTEAGKAQLANPDGSIAWVDSNVQAKQVDLFDGNTGYKFNILDLQRSAVQKMPLSSIKPETCLNSTLSLAQDIAYRGDASRDITGFFNNPDIPSMTTVGATAWIDKSAKQILADVNYLFNQAHSITKTQEFKPSDKAIRLMLPVDKWGDIATKTITDTSDVTILEFIVKKCPYLTSESQVIASPEIDATKMRIYHHDKKKLCFYWGHMLKFLAPQSKDLELRVPAHFSIGGLVVRNPLSIFDMDGI